MTNDFKLVEVSKEQFEIFFYGRTPFVKTFSEEVNWFKYVKDDVTILATIVLCKIDNDYNAIFLGRDLDKKFRAIKVIVSRESKDTLICDMEESIAELLSQHKNGCFMQGDEYEEAFSIFLSKVPEHKKTFTSRCYWKNQSITLHL